MIPPLVNRVVVVVLDGLRPDAIGTFGLKHCQELIDTGAYTLSARTVAPSVTACAMSSLLTGALPCRHGMLSDKFTVPRPRGAIHPVPSVLAARGLPTSAHIARLPLGFGFLADRIARTAGVQQLVTRGRDAAGILDHARDAIIAQQSGFVLLHWPDADRAGHKHGWMSPQYGDAARQLDVALGELVRTIDFAHSPGTLLIALADHGGGGVDRRNHNSAHVSDRVIPIMLAGRAVAPGPIAGLASLLDVPATILWSLAVPIPVTYAGRPLVHAFAAAQAAA